VECISTGPEDPEFRRNYAKMMKMVDCIEEQVDFVTYYLSTCSPHQDWYSLGTIIQDTLSGYTLADVRVSVDAGNAEIFTDLLMTRVFANLIENAVRHGGNITEIRIMFSEGPEYGLITIEDDGVGISPGEKSNIFAPGYGHNTGMGLYLARMILEITGFSIRETGREGHGARFEIRIPPGHYRIGD